MLNPNSLVQSNPSNGGTTPEIDFSIHDAPGKLSRANIKSFSSGDSSSIVMSPDLKFGIRFVDISGSADYKLVKIPFDGTEPTFWSLPFRIHYASEIGFSKMNPNSEGIAFVSTAVDSSIANLYYFNFTTGVTACLSCPMVANGGINPYNGKEIQFANGNSRLVFVADADFDGRLELYSNNLNGTDRIKLNSPMSGAGLISSFVLNSSGDAVAYVGNHTAASPYQLYYVTTLGTSLTRVSPVGVANSKVKSANYFFNLGGNKILFTQDRDALNMDEVFVANIDGSSVLKLNAPIVPAGGDVVALQMSPDDSKVLYYGDQDIDNAKELYVANIDGSGVVKLSSPVVAGRTSAFVMFDLTGSKVIYKSDLTTVDVFNLYVVDLNGSNRQLLLSSFGKTGGGVLPNPGMLFISNNQFYLLADFDFDYRYNLYRLNLDGTGLTTIYANPANYGFVYNSTVSDFFDATTNRFYFTQLNVTTNTVCYIKSIAADGSGEATLYDCTTGNFSVVSSGMKKVFGNKLYYQIGNRSFVTSFNFATTYEVYGSGTALISGFDFSPDSKKLAGKFLDKAAVDNGVRLSIVDIDTGRLTNLLPSSWNETVYTYSFSANSQTIGLSVMNLLPEDYIFKVNTDGSNLTNLVPSHGGFYFWGFDLKFSKDGQYIVYSADHASDTDPEIISMKVDGSNWTMIHPSLSNESGIFEITPQSDKVVFSAQRDSATFEIFSSNIDGSGHIKLNSPVLSTAGIFDFKLSPGGRDVLYQADQNISGVQELFVVNVDGTGMKRLSPALSGAQDVSYSTFTPDGQTVVFVGNINSASTNDLYSVKIDGSGFVKISPAMVAGGGLDLDSSLQITSDSKKVVYKAKATSLTREDVYISSLLGDGSICLSCSIASASLSISDIGVSSTEDRIYFRANLRGNNLDDLFSVKTDGTDLRQLNNNILSTLDGVQSFKLVNGGVVYLQYKNGNSQLFRVSGDGSSHKRLHAELLKFQNVSRNYLVSPDGKSLAYFLNDTDVSYPNLYFTNLDLP